MNRPCKKCKYAKFCDQACSTYKFWVARMAGRQFQKEVHRDISSGRLPHDDDGFTH